MDKQQAQKIVDGLRAAQDAKGAVVELLGQEARNFKFVKEPDRKVLVGSFRVEVGRTFFVSMVSSPRNDDDFSFAVCERPNGNVVLSSNLARADGVHWKYQPAKQHGDNQARKTAFIDAAGSDTIVIPFPAADISAFNAAVTQAIELRRRADGAGGADDGDEVEDQATPEAAEDGRGLLAQLFTAESERVAAAKLLAASIRAAHASNPKSWCVTNPAGRDRIFMNVGNLRVLALTPGEIMIFVDPDKVPATVIESLGTAWALMPDDVRYPYGLIHLAPSEAAALPVEVHQAHAAFMAHATGMTT